MNTTRGASLIDTVVGVALMLLIFVGIAGAFQLSIELVSNNKARIGATALAQEQMEYIRSLSYDSMGVVGGIPAGSVPQTETILLNSVSYTRRALIRYVDDAKDGLGAQDSNSMVADSKEIKVSVSWQSSNGERTIALVSRASPPGIEQLIPGGTISISVQNVALQPVSSATVRIVNANTVPAIDVTSLTNASGTTAFIGAPASSGYQITVTKSGYSSAQTYSATEQNPNPNPGHLTVSNNQTTSGTFSIDLLGSKTIFTFEQEREVSWSDPFDDDSLLASTTKTVVASGNLRLTGPGAQNSPGFTESVNATSTLLKKWRELSWVDTEPTDTEVRYRVLYESGGVFVLIPDAALPGNSSGFSISPVNLSALSTTTYSTLRIHSTLISENQNETPKVNSYTLTYIKGSQPLPNVQFSMRGNKVIGADGGGAPIYKYNQTLSTNQSGTLLLENMEEDTYTITVAGSTGYDMGESCLPQPRTLPPAGSVTTSIYLASDTAHSLLVDVKNNAGAMIPNATVRLYRLPVYDTTQVTETCGQRFFSGLSEGTVGGGNTYSVDVSAAGYQAYTSGSIEVSGVSRLSVVFNVL